MLNSDLSILISSCDKFSDLWENNVILFDKYWKTHPPIFLLTDKENHLLDQIKFKSIVVDAEFSGRLLKALDEIKTEYVFLTLDDYLLKNYVNIKKIDELFDYMKTNDLSYLRLFKRTITHRGYYDKKLKIKKLLLTDKVYEVNLYPSIWKVCDLKKLIINKNENIWKFEVRLTRRCHQNRLKCGWTNNKKIFDFIDTIRKGKYLRNAYRFLKKENLYISQREKRSIKETLYLNVRTFISRHIPSSFRNFLKKLSKKKYYSDYSETDD